MIWHAPLLVISPLVNFDQGFETEEFLNAAVGLFALLLFALRRRNRHSERVATFRRTGDVERHEVRLFVLDARCRPAVSNVGHDLLGQLLPPTKLGGGRVERQRLVALTQSPESCLRKLACDNAISLWFVGYDWSIPSAIALCLAARMARAR